MEGNGVILNVHQRSMDFEQSARSTKDGGERLVHVLSTHVP